MQVQAPVKVVIIDDKRQIRDGLAALINGTEGFHCTGIFDSMEEALSRSNSQNADLVLVDIGLPGMSGIEGMLQVHSKSEAVAKALRNRKVHKK